MFGLKVGLWKISLTYKTAIIFCKSAKAMSEKLRRMFDNVQCTYVL